MEQRKYSYYKHLKLYKHGTSYSLHRVNNISTFINHLYNNLHILIYNSHILIYGFRSKTRSIMLFYIF